MKIIHEKLSSSLNMILRILKLNHKRTKETLIHGELKKGYIEDYQPKKHFLKEIISDITVFSIFSNDSDKHIIYLHGGGYVLKGNQAHFLFMRKLTKSAGVNIHYIDYPLAPESTVDNTLKVVVDIIHELSKRYYFDAVTMMGDSAGGGLCIPVSKQVQSHLSVKQLILFSPWMDLSMENDAIKKMDHEEISLNIEDLLICANKYSPEDLRYPQASPLYLDVSDLKSINIYAGTHDLLYPDMELFEQKNQNVILHSYVGAPHVFALFPFVKEQKEIIQYISEII